MNRLQLSCCAAIATALMSATAAHADTADAAAAPAASTGDPGGRRSSPGLSDIIVTARRRSENLQDVPLSVTAFSQRALQEQRITDRTSLADNTPSLFAISGGYPREFAYFALRGQGPAFGSVPGVLNYFAEVPNAIGIDGRVGTYFDLANVQVLAGPQGTLFGKNATGGNILFEPMRPRNDFDGYMKAEYGNYNDRRVEGALNVPILPDRALLRVGGEIGRRDGYTNDVGPFFPGKDYDNLKYESFRASLIVRPANGIENYTVVRFYNSNNNGPGTALVAISPAAQALFGPIYPNIGQAVDRENALGPRHVAYDLDEFSKTSYWQIVNQTTVDLSAALKLKNIISYSRFRSKYAYDYDATLMTLAGQSSSTIPTLAPNFFTEELQLQGNAFGKLLSLTVGGYYDRVGWHDPAGIENFIVGPGLPTIQFLQSNRGHSEAVFGQGTIDLGKVAPGLSGLSLTGGLRYTWEHSFVSTQVATTAPVAGAVNSKYPSYTATLDYDIARGIHAYVTARDAYKSGGVNGPVPIGSSFRTFPPEKLADIEIGIKSQFMVGGVEVRGNVAAYRGIYSNIQRTTLEPIDGVTLQVTRSAAKGRIEGVEFTGAIVPFKGLTLNGSYSYIESRYTKVADQSAQAILAGSAFPYTPKNKFTVGASYELPVGDSSVVLATNYNHQSRVSTAQTNSAFLLYLPGYGTMNASVDLKNVGGRSLDIGVFASNLTNKTFPVGVIDLYTASSGTVDLTYNEPRMYGIRVGYRFGQ